MKKELETWIKDAGYENIYVDCPHCFKENIYNRISENIGDYISRLEGVKCQCCEKKFTMKGDRVVFGKWRWFIEDRHILKERKEYRLYILNLCQACECFFEQAILKKLLLIGKNGKSEAKFKKATFVPLRKIFLYQFSDNRKNYIPTKRKPKEDKRELSFKCIEDSKIGNLRNKVVHKSAYRPSLEEVESFDCLIKSLSWIRMYLDI